VKQTFLLLIWFYSYLSLLLAASLDGVVGAERSASCEFGSFFNTIILYYILLYSIEPVRISVSSDTLIRVRFVWGLWASHRLDEVYLSLPFRQ